jgi:putative flippase GtrA
LSSPRTAPPSSSLPQSGRNSRESSKSRIVRWLKFNAVGAGGIVVQLVVLTVVTSVLKIDYLIGTAVAVEAAIIHNYLWHERFTWLDRATESSWMRFLKFNLSTGLFSIVGNLLLMKALVEGAHLNYLVANLITIATCSIVNFVVSDLFVFEES